MTLWQTLFGFAGRIGRSTFWLLIIAVFLLDLAVVALVSDWIHSQYLEAGIPHRPGGDVIGAGFGLLVVGLISVWAAVGVMVKRAHDLERRGWWLLIGLIPVYGLARLVMDLGFLPGASRRNRFGEGASSTANRQTAQAERPAILALESVEPLQGPLFESQPDEKAPVEGGSPPIAQTDVAAESEHPMSEPQDVQPETFEPAPALVHPLMIWGKAYRADLSWPEFHADAAGGWHEALTADKPATEPGPKEVDPAGLEMEAVQNSQASAEPMPEPPPAEEPEPQPEFSWQAEPPITTEPLAQDWTHAQAEAPVYPELEPHAETEDRANPQLQPVLSDALAWMPAPSHESLVDLDAHAPEPANDSHSSREPL